MLVQGKFASPSEKNRKNFCEKFSGNFKHIQVIVIELILAATKLNNCIFCEKPKYIYAYILIKIWKYMYMNIIFKDHSENHDM